MRRKADKRCARGGIVETDLLECNCSSKGEIETEESGKGYIG